MLIDFIQDIGCPFCRIGKRHLELALAQWQGRPVQVRYRSFLLKSDIPEEGHDFLGYMRQKGGDDVDPERFFAGPREMGRQVGLTFNFDKITRAPNTMLAHRVIKLAPEDSQHVLVGGIYDAYFEFGRDIGDLDVLLDIAADAGLAVDSLRAALDAGEGRAEVEADSAWGHRLGVNGVPFFVIDGRFGLSGAQPPEIILAALQQAQDQTGEKIS